MRPLLLIAFVASGCCSTPPAACPSPDPDLSDSVAVRASTCHRAGEHLKALKCSTYRADWDAFCTEMLDSGIPLRPSCLEKVATCAEADTKCR